MVIRESEARSVPATAEPDWRNDPTVKALREKLTVEIVNWRNAARKSYSTEEALEATMRGAEQRVRDAQDALLDAVANRHPVRADAGADTEEQP